MTLDQTPASGQEWRVRVHLDLGAAGRPGALLTGLPGAPQGGDEFANEPHWHRVEACAAHIGRALSDIALAARQYPAPDPLLVGSAGRTVLNGAYLLPADHARGFAATVHELTGAHAALQAEVSGPWPPYTFAAAQLRALASAGG